MAKLHIYRKVGGIWSKQADGDGTLSSSENFGITLTFGSVAQGTTYQIRQGTSGDGENYNCLTGATNGKTATFHKAAVEVDLTADAYVRAVRDFRLALLASQKTVSIEIDTDDLKTLKGSDYKLCFAKKVGNEAYNVVWQAYGKYLSSNDFSWTPTYQLFGSNTFIDNISVKVATNKVDIGLGEQSTLDDAGVLSPASSGGKATSITMINDYGTIHPGVNQLSTGVDGNQVSSPIYVATNPIVLGKVELTPVEKVLVWFEQNIETSTMFSNSRSKAVEIDLTTVNSATRLYQGGQWTTP